MILAFQILLTVMMIVAIIGVIAEKQDVKLRGHLTAIFIFSIMGFITTALWL